MQKIFLFLCISITSFVRAQTNYYAASKTGISLRELPNATAKVIAKVGYGERLTSLPDSFPPKYFVIEGFTCSWYRVNFNGKQGYVASAYLLPAPAPKNGVTNLKDYFLQVSAVLGEPLIIKKTDEALNEMGESTLTKHFFKNGMEWHQTQGYENASEVYILPGFTIAQSFLLLRLLNQYPDLIGQSAVFPTKKSRANTTAGEKTIEIEREDGNNTSPIKKIKIINTEAVITEFEIFTLDEQAVIYWTSGV